MTEVPLWAQTSPLDDEESPPGALGSASAAVLASAVTDRPVGNPGPVTDLRRATLRSAADPSDVSPPAATGGSVIPADAELTAVNPLAADLPPPETENRQRSPQRSPCLRIDVMLSQSRPGDAARQRRKRPPSVRTSPVKRPASSVGSPGTGARSGDTTVAAGPVRTRPMSTWRFLPQTSYLRSAMMQPVTGELHRVERVSTVQLADDNVIMESDSSDGDMLGVSVTRMDRGDAAETGVTMVRLIDNEASDGVASDARGGDGLDGLDISGIAVSTTESSNAIAACPLSLNDMAACTGASSALASCAEVGGAVVNCAVPHGAFAYFPERISVVAFCAEASNAHTSRAVSCSAIANPSEVCGAVAGCAAARTGSCSAATGTGGGGTSASFAVSGTDASNMDQALPRHRSASDRFVYHSNWKIDRYPRNTVSSYNVASY